MRGRTYLRGAQRPLREQEINKKREALKDNPDELQKFEKQLEEEERQAIKFLLVFVFITLCAIAIFYAFAVR